VRLPNYERAILPVEKVRDYLLSDSHPIGRYKAAVFRSLGYESENSEVLVADLRKLLIFDAAEVHSSEFGAKYAVRGTIRGPNGESGVIVSIWIVRNDEDFPRFVTAYPE
jgi:hypothetical protein